MKKRAISFILVGLLTLSACGCGKGEPEAVSQNSNAQSEIVQQSEESQEQESTDEEEFTETEVNEEEFSFEDFRKLEFCFSSGAGGWATQMTVHADGSFSGEYFDGDLGVTGEGYPNGTMYRCDFSGQFTQPVKVNEYTYSMKISELNYEEEVGKEEIKNGMLFCYTEAYGLDGADNILIYLPGAPLEELPEEFRSWVGYYNLSDATDTELPFYALNNEAQQYGFMSYDVVERIKVIITQSEENAAELEESIENDSLTQAEYNEKTGQLYDIWDFSLNQLWDVLKQTQSAEKMQKLTNEEREWIALKEKEVAEAGAEYEGGSIQPMVMNLKAAEMTKARVYELLELLE